MAAERSSDSRAGVADIRLVESDSELASLIGELLEVEVYAIDTEFHRERTYWPQVALVQLAWGEAVALIDATKVDLGPLARLFGSEGLAVAHAAAQDLEVFQRHCGRVPSRLFDTQLAAAFLGAGMPSLASLADRFLKLSLPKADRLTDWLRRPLSEGQIRYAASDVSCLLELNKVLRAELERQGRLAWAEEECERLRLQPRQPPHPEEAWWRLRHCRGLRGASRGVAQEVAAWRERKAAQLNRPARSILSDLAIEALVAKPPRSRGELFALRGIDGWRGRLDDGAAAELLQAIERGLSLTERSLRLPPRSSPETAPRQAVALCGAWIQERAEELGLDAAMLATREDLEAFVRQEGDCRLRGGWRWEVVGRELAAILSGDVALAVRAGSRLALVNCQGQQD
jgi:ribonuclease D